MKIIKEVSKRDLKSFLLRNIDTNDSSLYKEANNKNKIGIFQLTAGTSSRVLNDIKPVDFDELNACTAFARPGTIDFLPQYLKNRAEMASPYPDQVSSLLDETYGVILYQEQLMKIFNKIGGFTLEETDEVRSLMKKLGKAEKKKEDLDAWDVVVKRFEKGAIEKNIKTVDAKNITEDLLKMASYSFNKSHSTSYTYISIMTLYLSFYFRKYFYSSTLTYEVSRDKYLNDRIKSIKNQGFEVLPPDINESKLNICPVGNNKLIFGLSNIKYVGGKAC